MTTRRGFALLSALWLMVMLSGIGLHIAVRARSGRLAAINRIESTRVRAAADAGVEHARARLTRRLRGGRPGIGNPVGAVRHPWHLGRALFLDTVTLGDARYAVHLRDVNARLHLNLAAAEELRDLMIALRVDAGRADRVAQAIVDWRDADDLRQARGAERRDYEHAGARAMPRNSPFTSVAELRDVLGVDAPLLARIEPFLTTFGTGQVNPNTASEQVLLVLPGFSTEIAASLLRLRASGIVISSSDQLLAAVPIALRSSLLEHAAAWRSRLVFETHELEFESVAWLAQGPARVSVRGSFVRVGERVMLTGHRVE